MGSVSRPVTRGITNRDSSQPTADKEALGKQWLRPTELAAKIRKRVNYVRPSSSKILDENRR